MPILAILFNAFYLFVTLYDDIQKFLDGKTPVMNSVFGLVVVAIGIPFYAYFKRKSKGRPGGDELQGE
jgi:hypothetical protein